VSFRSILFDRPETCVTVDASEEPHCFRDLHLDQIVASITAGRDEYNLKPFFYTPLRDIDSINYRHEIMRDLDNRVLFGQLEAFSKKMRMMREHLAQAEKLRYVYQTQRCFLDAVDIYCEAITGLVLDLAHTVLRSSGLLSFRDYLSSYVSTNEFAVLATEAKRLKADVSGLRYCLHIEGNRVAISRYDSEPDYQAEVLRTLEKFRQVGSVEYKFNLESGPRLNQVEEVVLDRVARLYPVVFSSLEQFYDRHRAFLDETIRRFDREIQFYVACLDQVNACKSAGLAFCYPTVSAESKEVSGREVFDLALAKKLTGEKKGVVCNDFYLSGAERVLVVSGANQGGKTTLARSFGQLHYLASVGCPVPGSAAQLFLFDRLFTHFEREEDLENLSSKLENDLLRIHSILRHATPRSILIMNESFSSATLHDGLFLSRKVMTQIIQRHMLCVAVTFFDELTSLSDTIVSMVATVEPTDRTHQTFKVVRKPADGLAYAAAISEKYRLTYADLQKRVAS
jgi:DNA mismatch repair protein MutS